MAIVLDDVATYLQTQGIGTIGTNLFKGSLPDSPDALVALIEVGGDAPIDVLSMAAGTIKVERPVIRVVARAGQDDYQAARTKAASAYQQLHGLTGQTLSGTRYLTIEARHPPFNLGRDENGRWLSGFDALCWKDPNA